MVRIIASIRKRSDLTLFLHWIGVFLFTLFTSSCESGNAIVRNGKSEYKIYISPNAARPDQHAAKELQKYLQLITGRTLDITNQSSTLISCPSILNP